MSVTRSCEEFPCTQTKRVKYEISEESKSEGECLQNTISGKQITSKLLPPLLTLSDEILLSILRLLDPRDVISLGRTCRRLAGVVRDRTLWAQVDLSAQPLMLCQLELFLPFFQPTTRVLFSRGPAPLAVSHSSSSMSCSHQTPSALSCTSVMGSLQPGDPRRCAPSLALKALGDACPALETLHATHHCFDARRVYVTDFPASLKKLSLQGCEAYYVPREKSYFRGLNKHMLNLQELVLDDCQWLRADCLMAISKCPLLRRLSLRRCRNIGACYAYVSLASRFGFKALEVLDVRESALSDHEISSFQSISSLTHLYLEVPEKQVQRTVGTGCGKSLLQNHRCGKYTCRAKSGFSARVPDDVQASGECSDSSSCAPAEDSLSAESEFPFDVQCVCTWGQPPMDGFIEHSSSVEELPASPDSTSDVVRESTLIYGADPSIDMMDEDLAGQLDPVSLITDAGVGALGTRQVVVLDNARRPQHTTVHRNPNLYLLSVAKCRGITDATLQHLSMLASLRRLDVRGTAVTVEGINKFRGKRSEVKVNSDFGQVDNCNDDEGEEFQVDSENDKRTDVNK